MLTSPWLALLFAAYHVGDSVDIDVVGAASAGWTPVRYNEHFDEDFPDWLDTDSADKVGPCPPCALCIKDLCVEARFSPACGAVLWMGGGG